MRSFFVVTAMLGISAISSADELSQADRDAILAKLQKMEDAAQSNTDARFATAVSAYRGAVGDDQAAIALYLKCVEKLNFTDRDRKPQDFREWKRQNADNHAKPGFGQALRVQLRWLLLTLQVASSKKDVTEFASEATSMMESVLASGPALLEHRGIVSQGGLGSVFAQAYDLKSLKVENWPSSPMEVESIYEQLVFPPLRSQRKADELRAAWNRRIQHQAMLVGKWVKEEESAAAMAAFQKGTYLDLVWQMELDVYNSGDQRGAALRMFQHIEKYVASPRAMSWAKQLKSLLENPDVPAEMPAPESEPQSPPRRPRPSARSES